MASIGQSAYPDLLPDFRNLGVMARVLVAVNALAVAAVLFATPTLEAGLQQFMRTAAYLEPLLLVQLLALAALSPLLARSFAITRPSPHPSRRPGIAPPAAPSGCPSRR